MVNEDGTLKPEALKATARASGGGKTDADEVGNTKSAGATAKKDGAGDGKEFDEKKAVEEASKKLEGVKIGDGPTGGGAGTRMGGGDDDVD